MNIYRDSISMIIGKSIKTFGNLIFTMVISRVLIAEQLGTYKQIITISTVLFTIVPLGIPTSISYYYKLKNNRKNSELITNSNIFLLCSGILISVLLYISRNIIGEIFNNVLLINNILGLIFYSFIMIISSIVENSYVVSGKSIYISTFNTIYYIIYYLISCIYIFKTSNLNNLLFLMSFLELLRIIYLNVKLYKSSNLIFITNKNFFKDQFIFCLPLGLAMIVQNINTELDKIAISLTYSPIETAIYSNGAMNIPFVGLISVTVASVSLPLMVNAYEQEGFRKVLNIWNNTSLFVYFILISIFFGILYYSTGYIELLFSKTYIQSLPIFIIYLIKLPLSFTVFGNILIIIGKKKATLYNMLGAVIVNIILNYIFIDIYGLSGPAFASVLIHLLLIILQLIQISKSVNIKIIDLLPYKQLIGSTSIAFIVSLVIKYISNLFYISEILKLFIFGSITVIISLSCILFFYRNLISKLIKKEY